MVRSLKFFILEVLNAILIHKLAKCSLFITKSNDEKLKQQFMSKS